MYEGRAISMLQKDIQTPEEVIYEANICVIELQHLHGQAMSKGWDIPGEVDTSSIVARAESVIHKLSAEVVRMKECMVQVDEDASRWHQSISKQVCRGAFPQYTETPIVSKNKKV
jgi:hypothetical protein